MLKEGPCSICGIDYAGRDEPTHWKFGNNAAPVNNGRCCNDCNENIVLPARIRLYQRHDKEKGQE